MKTTEDQKFEKNLKNVLLFIAIPIVLIIVGCCRLLFTQASTKHGVKYYDLVKLW